MQEYTMLYGDDENDSTTDRVEGGNLMPGSINCQNQLI